jgi:hypothetical protein
MITELIAPVVIAIITSVVGPALVEWVKKRRENKPKDPLFDAVKHNEIIEQQLDLMLKELDCGQIYIAQFHNGGHFYPTGKSIQKFSIFYEVTTPETPSIKGIFQNIPVSLFSKPLSMLYETGEILVDDTSILNTELGLESFCPESQYKSVYLLAIHDLDNRIVGVMGIYYTNKKHKITKEEWIFIRQKIGAIGNIMSNYLHNKRK